MSASATQGGHKNHQKCDQIAKISGSEMRHHPCVCVCVCVCVSACAVWNAEAVSAVATVRRVVTFLRQNFRSRADVPFRPFISTCTAGVV